MAGSIAADGARAALWIWLAVHFLLLALADLAASRTTLLGLPPIVFAIVLLDQRACRESVILGNLGVPLWLAPAVGGGVALALEVVVFSVWS